MIILYVPFERQESGDLSRSVDLWKEKHQNLFAEAIFIIFHKQPLPQLNFQEEIRLYICAHGTEDGDLVYNSSNYHSNIKSISIPTLSERFNYDFLYLAPRIQQIHLYCCGNEDKNMRLAALFQSNLLRKEYSTIHFYKGNIEIPKKNYFLNSYVDNSQKHLPVIEELEVEEKYFPKTFDLSFFKQERILFGIDKRKRQREERLMAMRGIKEMMEIEICSNIEVRPGS
ncbi:hypothetical protein EP47_02520 [Legionella norrlandica]|uniref:RNA binding protein (Contains ribosomal protein S1 domain) n=1 Tax=Legionella norrlandica TaxID=1498499 RepID=A0A0A2SNF3_9GAMM|nr:hypothetical protein [Legionella norrlandica]KGP62680.1 hypothetical protein EP47_02520 [Legionella norrlandica]